MNKALLQIDELEVFYGNAQAIQGISLKVEQGELLSLIGSNGAGKSTLFKAICGMVQPRSGSIWLNGHDTKGLAPARITERGVAMVPEGRRLFRSLTVEENLILGGYVGRPGPWTLKKVYEVFPILQERRGYPATSLSGGQQQMVAIGRACSRAKSHFPATLMRSRTSRFRPPISEPDTWNGSMLSFRAC